MEDHSLAKAYPAIAESIVHITVTRSSEEYSEPKVTSGTGTIIGFTRTANQSLIATARHVLPTHLSDGEQMRVVVRYTASDGSKGQVQEFTARAGEPPPGVFWATGTSEKVDVGALMLPPTDSVAGDYGNRHRLPTVVTDTAVPAPATRVAWAGFPGLVKREFDEHVLCYFEGSVSALLPSRGLLLIDGHAMPGVSGGPVWFFDDRAQKVAVVGVVSGYFGYRQPEQFHPDHRLNTADPDRRDRMPGFLVVQPLIPAMAWIRSAFNVVTR